MNPDIYIFFLNPHYVAARSLRSLQSNNFNVSIHFTWKLTSPFFPINKDIINTRRTSGLVQISVAVKLGPHRAVIGNDAIPAPSIGYGGVGKAFSDHPCREKEKRRAKAVEFSQNECAAWEIRGHRLRLEQRNNKEAVPVIKYRKPCWLSFVFNKISAHTKKLKFADPVFITSGICLN